MTRARALLLRPVPVGHGGPVSLPNLLLVAVPALILLALVERGTSVVLPAAELLIGAAAIAVVARFPGQSVAVLVVYVPMQLVGLALLLKYGVPAGVVRALGSVKDVIVAGLLINGLWTARRHRRRLDVADKFAVFLVGLILLYLVAPSIVPGMLGSAPLYVRVLAARVNGLFVLCFLGARYADIPERWRERIVRTVLALAAVMSVGAIINVLAPQFWNRLLILRVGLPAYNTLITGAPPDPSGVLTKVDIGGHLVVRASSFMASGLVLGFFLLVAFGILLQRLTRHRLLVRDVVLVLLVAVAVVATATRSAILAALVTALVASRVAATRKAPGWLRLLFCLVAAAIAVAPVAAATTAGQRVAEATSGQDTSTQGHITALENSSRDLIANPLGRGLGTGPSIGERFQVNGHLTSEDVYLQVGNEIGVPSMFAFIGFLISSLVLLWRRAKTASGSGLAAGMVAAGVGLAIGSFFLHVWLDYATALTYWALAGLALNDPPTPADA